EEGLSEPSAVRSSADELETGQKGKDWFRRNRISFGTIGLLVIIAAFAGGYALRNLRSVSAPFSKTEMHRLTGNGHVSDATLSPDGQLFAYSLSEGERHSLWLAHTSGGGTVELRPSGEVRYLNLQFAPDGSSLDYTAIGGGENGFYRSPVLGGVPEQI